MGRLAVSVLAAAAIIGGTSGLVQAGTAQPVSATPAASPQAVGQVRGTLYYVSGSTVWSWTPGASPKKLFTGSSTSAIWATASVSPDGRYLSYFERGSAYPEQNLRVKDLKTGTDRVVYAGIVQGGSICSGTDWAPDGAPKVFTATGINDAGDFDYHWIDVTTGIVSDPLPGACNAVPVARGDGSYDLYAAQGGEMVRISPDGTTTQLPYAGQILRHAFGAGPRQVSSMSADGTVACVTVGSPHGPFSRPLQCEIVLEPATGKIITTINTNNPDPQPGTVEFLQDGRMLIDNGTKVSLRSADGYDVLAESAVPASLQGMDLLSYRP